ncbi:hypothetical protein PMIN04_006453 [Paraphaeosphaeria minitans]
MAGKELQWDVDLPAAFLILNNTKLLCCTVVPRSILSNAADPRQRFALHKLASDAASWEPVEGHTTSLRYLHLDLREWLLNSEPSLQTLDIKI